MLKKINDEALTRFLSSERLASYVRQVNGDKHKAIELYLENIRLCQRFYVRLHWVEIGLRNAMNRQLSQKYGGEWFDNPHTGLGEKERAQVQKAREHLLKDKKPLTNSNMVAELNFGLWVNLFNFPYEKLWRFPLRKAFAGHGGTLTRHQVSKKLHPLLKLRNRIAHYEPIIGYDLPKMQQDMVDIVRWIEPNIATIMEK